MGEKHEGNAKIMMVIG